MRLSAGSEPGSPRQIGQVCELGGAPNSVAQPQNIFEAVPSSTCTSRPRTGSYAATASSYGISADGPAAVASDGGHSDAASFSSGPPQRSASAASSAAPTR